MKLPVFWILLYAGMIVLISLMIQGLKNSLRDAQTSRTTNKIVIFSAAIILTAISTLVLTSVIFSSSILGAHDTKADNGCTIDDVRYDDCSEPQPIKVQNVLSLGGVWSYTAEQQQTFLLSYTEYIQYSLSNESSYHLYCSVADVKIPLLISFMREKALVKRDFTFQIFDNFYQPLDAPSYGVEEIYQLYYDSEASGTYYIFNKNKIVKIRFSESYSDEQRAQVLKAYCDTLTA